MEGFQLAARWRALASRERILLLVMLAVLLAAAVWFGAMRPALRTLGTAPAQIAALETQRSAMLAMAAQARGMQAREPLPREDALRELEATVRQRLGGSGQLTATADRITVVLRGAPPQALAPWLSQARLQARVVATQASLTRGPSGWDGTIVFHLPTAP
jgi:general secretion pathway protein M